MPATVRGFQPEEEVSWVTQETPFVVIGATATGQAVQDFIASVTTATGIDNNCKLSVSPSKISGTYTADSQTPAVCSVDPSGNVTRLADGVCNIGIYSPGSSKLFSRTMARSGSGTVYAVTGWATGSLSKHIADQIATMVSGKTPGQAAQWLFNNAAYNSGAPSGTRNVGIFSGAVDLSPFSFTRSGNAVMFPLTLISAQHFICAAHVMPVVGETIVWLDNSNVFHTATVTSRQQVAGDPDICVGYLTWIGAPSGIIPVSFMPATWQSKIPSLVSASNYGQVANPVLMNLYDDATAQRKLHVGEWYRQPVGYPLQVNYDPNGYQGAEAYAGWSSAIQGGDSSSPVFVPINGATVLLCSLWQSTISSDYSASLTGITSMMQSLAQAAGDVGYASYAPLQVSLAGFNAY